MDHLLCSICEARAGIMPALAFLRRTVGRRDVCVVQTCRMRGRSIKPHTSARRAPRRGANGCVDMPSLRWSVNLTVTCSARRRYRGQGSPCKLRFGTKTRCLRFSCAARKAKSVVQFSFRLEEFFDFHLVPAINSKISEPRIP